jgi:hypothetical protein
MRKKYPHIEAVGLPVKDGPVPYVPWSVLRLPKSKLGQWVYGLALRTSYRDHTRYGPRAEDVEEAIADMAKGRCWPREWQPKATGESR